MATIRVHVVDPADVYHHDVTPYRTNWHNLFGTDKDALNGNISRVFLTYIPQSLASSNYTQETDYCCGPSSIACALGLSKDTEPHNWLANNGYMTSTYGTSYSGIVAYLKHKGYPCTYDGKAYDGNMTTSAKCYTDIINHLSAGYKVILCMHHSRSNYWTNFGHYIEIDKISGADLDVDGKWGTQTTLRAQQVFGTYQDGIVSNQMLSAKKYLEGCETSSWEFVADNKLFRGSELIRAIQKKAGVSVDGFCGLDTIRAMQKWLGVTVDGKFGNLSVQAFQKWLNKQ